MAYKALVSKQGEKTKYCYTPNCSLHNKTWTRTVVEQPKSKRDYQALFDQTVTDDADRKREPKDSSAKVLNGIPRKQRVTMTAEQLDAAYGIMRQFGTRDDDSWGFRSHIATKRSFYEWSERGFGARYSQDIDSDGNVKDVRLYSISDYGTNPATFYKGQAALRRVFGLEPYNASEKAHIAEQYWTANILPTLGDIPQPGGEQLRRQYIADIAKSDTLVDEVVDEWEENPQHRINDTPGSARAYLEIAVMDRQRPYGQEGARTKLLRALDTGNKRAFLKALRDHDGTLSRENEAALSKWAKKGFAKVEADA